MIPLLLFTLALIDAAFCGFRSAAGRSLLIDKYDYFLRALARGGIVGLGVLAIIGAAVGITLLTSPEPAQLYAAYVRAGTPMVYWYGPYATIVLLALAFYGSARPEWRALSTTIVLGPLTLLRPAVIIGGAIHALTQHPPPAVTVSIVIAAIVMPPLGWFQNRRYRAQSPFEA